MKKCITILIGLIPMYALTAQTPFTQCLRADVDLGYTLSPADGDFGENVNAPGFGVGMDYCLGTAQLRFVASPFIFMWQGKDLADMKSFYKTRDFTLTAYNGGTYYSSGVLFGLHYAFKRAIPDKLPVVTTTLQYGFQASNLPETEATYNSAEADGIIQRSSAAKGFGTALRLGVGMDVLKSGNTIYHVGLSYRREASDIAHDVTSNIAVAQTEIFQWRTNTLMLNLGATFALN